MLSRKKWVVVHTPGAEFGATLGAVTDCELYVEASWHEEDGRLIKRFERERRPVWAEMNRGRGARVDMYCYIKDGCWGDARDGRVAWSRVLAWAWHTQ